MKPASPVRPAKPVKPVKPVKPAQLNRRTGQTGAPSKLGAARGLTARWPASEAECSALRALQSTCRARHAGQSRAEMVKSDNMAILKAWPPTCRAEDAGANRETARP